MIPGVVDTALVGLGLVKPRKVPSAAVVAYQARRAKHRKAHPREPVLTRADIESEVMAAAGSCPKKGTRNRRLIAEKTIHGVEHSYHATKGWRSRWVG